MSREIKVLKRSDIVGARPNPDLGEPKPKWKRFDNADEIRERWLRELHEKQKEQEQSDNALFFNLEEENA